MTRIDDELRNALSRVARLPDSPDVFADLARRRRRRAVVRKGQSVLLAVSVVALSAMAFVGLSQLFTRGEQPLGSAGGDAELAFVLLPAGGIDSEGRGGVFAVRPDGSSLRELSPDDAFYGTPSWSPDGTAMAVLRYKRSEGEGIYRLDVETNDLRLLVRTGQQGSVSVRQLRWSPTGDHIGYIETSYVGTSEGSWPTELFVMRSDGSGVRNVTGGVDGQVTSFSWSPDGERIAFTEQTLASDGIHFINDLFVMSSDGTGLRRLTDDGMSSDPAWAPDGRAIAFLSGEPGEAFTRRGIYVMNADGTGRRRLTPPGPGGQSSPEWSGDGSLIAFTDFRSGMPDCEIAVVKPDGTDRRVLLAGADVGGCPHDVVWNHGRVTALPLPGPTLTPPPEPTVEATQKPERIGAPRGPIVFSDHTEIGWDLFSMAADGSDVTRLTSTDEDELGPRWSPDGTRLAFHVAGSGRPSHGVNVTDADGTGRIQVYEPESDWQVQDVAWSPNGAAIAVVVERIDTEATRWATELVVVDLETGDTRTLVDDPPGRVSNVDWSPDGTTLLFTRSAEDPVGRFVPNDLYLISPDGTRERRLTTDGISMNGVWSPDGSQIAFESYDPEGDGELNVFVMSADGTGRRQLTTDPGNDIYPSWSSDGSHILFLSRRSDVSGASSECHILLVDATTGQERTLARDEGGLCGADPSWNPTQG